MNNETIRYPHIDKPWLKYYRGNIKEKATGSLYQYLKECNKNNMKSLAVMYFGKKYTFEWLFNRIDVLAECFKENGIKPKDKVVVIGLNTPDLVSSIYALNKIGAIACIEYVTQMEDKLEKIVRDYNSRYAVVLDLFVDKYYSSLKNSNIEKVFVTGLSDNMPAIMRILSNIKKKQKKTDGLVSLNKYKCGNVITEYEWNDEETAILLSTSGTTGLPKRAELSNSAINSVAKQSKYCGLGMQPGKSILSPAPPFLAYGISLTMHMPLCNGLCVIMSPSPDVDLVAKQFIKYKPAFFIGGRANLDGIKKYSEEKKVDLSFVEAIEIGGEKVQQTYIDELDSFIHLHNSKGFILTGYGMTELAGCSTSQTYSVRKDGDVGIPLCNVNMKITDIQTGKELPYNEEGELWVNSPCIMNGYFNNEEETKNIISFDSDGCKWLHTGDLAKIDEDGVVYIVGRKKRIAVTKDVDSGEFFKLFPDYVEMLINDIAGVERCAVITTEDEIRLNTAVAYIKKSDGNITEKAIFELLEKKTERYNIPTKVYFVDRFPLLSNGKIDYRALK